MLELYDAIITVLVMLNVNKNVSSQMYSDDLFIPTRLFPADISGLTSFPDYWIAH